MLIQGYQNVTKPLIIYFQKQLNFNLITP